MLIFFKNKKLRRFLYYVDQNAEKGIEKRERVYKHHEYVEEGAPLSAPDCAKSGYDGASDRQGG